MEAMVEGEVFDLYFVEGNDLDFRGKQTCTFLGLYGHLHWVWKLSSFYLMPSAWSYIILMLAAVAAKPFYLFSAPILFMLVLYGVFTISFKGSYEAGSVWCWSALAFYTYLIIQPYVFHKDGIDGRGEDDQVKKGKESLGEIPETEV
jgi:hypothetical protein